MQELYQFSEPKLLAFILVLLRMSAFVVSWPVFGATNVPNPVKILLALIMAIVLFPVIGWQGIEQQVLSNEIIWLALREIFVGLLIGYLGRLFFYGINGAGELISFSMGLSSAQIFDPTLGGESSVVEQFQTVIATLIFLAINGHHLLIAGLVQSYSLVPLSVNGLNLKVFGEVALLGQNVIEMSVKIAAPMLVSVLIMNVALGIVGRAVPQINVLVTSFAVNILLGFLILIVSMPVFVSEMPNFLNDMTLKMFQVMKAL